MKSWAQPTHEEVDRAIALLVHAGHHRYFFDRLENPNWLQSLWKKNFFRTPPRPLRDETEGSTSFPPWPEADYLARMAQHDPELVVEIINEMEDTDNVAVHHQLMSGLLRMPAKCSVELKPKVLKWAKSPYIMDPLQFGRLMAQWADEGYTKQALRLARALLAVLPDPERKPPSPREGALPVYRPRARFDDFEYAEILRRHYPAVVGAAGLNALSVLCKLLKAAVHHSLAAQHAGQEDASYLWRPAVEDHPQNFGDTIRDALVDAVRDAAEMLVRSDKASVQETVQTLERRRWTIFRRIALHVLRVFADRSDSLIHQQLASRQLMNDVGVQHEYALLLRECFPRLPVETQQSILAHIDAGPDLEPSDASAKSEGDSAQGDNQTSSDCEFWQLKRLAWIGPDNLPKQWRERYQGLVQRFGAPEHSEFPYYVDAGWVGPRAAKSAEEFETMSVTEITRFLKAWRPAQDGFREPSIEGQSRELSSVVSKNPRKFASEASHFAELDPTYVRGLLEGLREGLEHGSEFAWEPVVELCEQVVQKPREIPGRITRLLEADPHWGWARKAIAHLFEAGFQSKTNPVPFVLRDQIWHVLRELTTDPEPTPEYESQYGGANMDPATMSINTTRGAAMHAVVRYALWVRRNLESTSHDEDALDGLQHMEEVRAVLEEHLDCENDPALAIRAVYGQWFPWLVALDRSWAKANAPRIFPNDDSSATWRDAAWNTYLAFCEAYDEVVEILREQYENAVKRVGVGRDDTRWLADPDEKLAEHLMTLYWRGKLALDDPILTEFFARATDALRAHALGFVGRALRRTAQDIPPEILCRLEKLWSARLASAQSNPAATGVSRELAAFGWWFISDKLDERWAINQLLESLRIAHKSERQRLVIEQLVRTIGSHAAESLECLRLIVKGDRDGWDIHASRENIRAILAQALQNPISATSARQLVNELGSRGFLEFRDLLPR